MKSTQAEDKKDYVTTGDVFLDLGNDKDGNRGSHCHVQQLAQDEEQREWKEVHITKPNPAAATHASDM